MSGINSKTIDYENYVSHFCMGTCNFKCCNTYSSQIENLSKGFSITVVREILLKNLSSSHLDPYSSTCEQEVPKIIHLQKIANQMPDGFTNLKRITKPHIHPKNVPIRIDIPIGPSTSVIANESKTHLKCSRPLGSKDQNPKKRKIKCQDDTMKESHMEVQKLNKSDIHERIMNLKLKKIMNYP